MLDSKSGKQAVYYIDEYIHIHDERIIFMMNKAKLKSIFIFNVEYEYEYELLASPNEHLASHPLERLFEPGHLQGHEPDLKLVG